MKLLHRHSATDIEPLRVLGLFQGCSDDDLRAARELMTSVEVEAGTTLISESDVGRQFFVIQSGTAEVRHADGPVAHLGPGQHFGEMALIDGRPRTATVRATSDMEVLVQDQREFDTMMSRSPAVARNIMRTLAQRLRAA